MLSTIELYTKVLYNQIIVDTMKTKFVKLWWGNPKQWEQHQKETTEEHQSLKKMVKTELEGEVLYGPSLIWMKRSHQSGWVAADVWIFHVSVNSFLLPFFSLSVFCSVSAVSCLGFGPLRPSVFPHQTRTRTDDPGCHPLSPPVEGGLKIRCIFIWWCLTPQHHSYVTLLISVLAGQHVGIEVCCSHALRTCLQTMGPGSHW